MRRGRLDDAILERFSDFGGRVLRLVDVLEEQKRHRRVVDQLCGSGTSAGAQVYEAAEAVSRRDFIKCLGWSAKELSETCYWLDQVVKAGWLEADRIEPLKQEATELLKIVKTIIARSKRSSA